MVDFSRCAMIDSAAIGALVDSNRQFKSGGGMLVLYSLAPRVKDVIQLLKLEQLFNLAPNEAGARAIFRAARALPERAPRRRYNDDYDPAPTRRHR